MMSPKQNDMENHLLILPGSQNQYLSELLTIYGRIIKILSQKKQKIRKYEIVDNMFKIT